MAKGGRKPIDDIPQKDMDPKDRNSRLFAFRVNRESGDANDVKVRAICDRWVAEGIFPEMIKKGVLLAEKSKPVLPSELTRLVMQLRMDQKDTIKRLEIQIDSLHQLIRHLTNGERLRVQRAQDDMGHEFPEGFIDSVLSNFDE